MPAAAFPWSPGKQPAATIVAFDHWLRGYAAQNRFAYVDYYGALVDGAGGMKPGLSSEEYVKQFGLGITTQFDKPLVTFGAGPQNNASIEALPSSDQVAYRDRVWTRADGWKSGRPDTATVTATLAAIS